MPRLRLAFLAAALALVAASPAAASPAQESIFMDDNRILYRGNAVSDATLQELKALGVDRVRLSVVWRNFGPASKPANPADPRAYAAERFDEHDHAVRRARQLGLDVLFNVVGGAPDWATGKPIPGDRRVQDGDVNPSPGAFRAFVEMLGRRYDGSYEDENQGGRPLPRVTAWSLWNEPNRGTLLAPQWQRDRKTRTWTPVGARLYRRLARAGIDGLTRTGHGGDTILLGETSPTGAPRVTSARSHAKPLAFLRDLLCLRPDLRPYTGRVATRRGCDFVARGPLKVTGYAHHPYSIVAPPAEPTSDPDHAALGDTARLARILDAAAAAGRIPANLPIWYTEYGYQTKPPDPYRGIPLNLQATWLSEAERITWADPRVVAHTQFLLRDDDPMAGYDAADPRYWTTYQSGLRFDDGRPKPALDAYRLPLAAPARIAAGQALILWGQVRPAANGEPTRVRIEHRTDAKAAWTTLGDRDVTDPRGFFELPVELPRAGEYRYVWPVPPPAGEPSPLDPLRGPRPVPTPFASLAVAVDIG